MCRWAEIAAAAAAFALAVVAPAASADGTWPRYGFGKVATAEQIAGWDIDVRPDGAGLPPGHGSVVEGQKLYDAQCATCHGTFGESAVYMQLAGGVGTLASDQPTRTTGSVLNDATTLFDYIRRAMPFTAPKSLTNDEVYALTAYVLNLSDIVPADTVLDRKSLVAIRMPNRNGFTTDHGFMTRDGRPDTHAVACMSECAQDVRVTSFIPDSARSLNGDLAQQMRSFDGAADVAAIAAAPATDAAAGGGAGMGAVLAGREGCMTCHAVDHAVVGPAFAEVAKRYRNDSDAATRLMRKVHDGGSGNWGSVAMPAQTQVAAADLRRIIEWILHQARQ